MDTIPGPGSAGDFSAADLPQRRAGYGAAPPAYGRSKIVLRDWMMISAGVAI
jgi:hypothetical protein